MLTLTPRNRFLSVFGLALAVLLGPGMAAAEISPSSDVLLPYFEVDLADPDAGLTTLFAVGNASPDAVDVLVTVHTNWGIPVLKLPLTLHADEVRTVNLRDWLVYGALLDCCMTAEELEHIRAALSGKMSPKDDLYYGTEVDPDLAVGYITFRSTGPDRPDVLWGDYYEISGELGVFQAETLVDIDPVQDCKPSCTRHAVRFLNAGFLTHGTQLLIWTERQWAPSPSPEPPGVRVSTDLGVFDEPGRLVENRALGLLPVGIVEVDHLDLLPKFGWLDIVTEEPSFIGEHLHSMFSPSAALHAYCLPEETVIPGAAVQIQKFVNGADADFPTGPSIPVGGSVTWEYRVKNVGTAPLSDVTVTDDNAGPVSCPQTTLEPNELMTCTLGGIAKACQQKNIGTVVAFAPDGTELSDDDPAHYFGQHRASLGLEKKVEGVEADGPDTDDGPWPRIPVGQEVHWTFEVTNTGDVELTGVAVADDHGLTVSCPKTVLQPGESMTCTATSLAVAGHQRNVATVTGTPPCGDDVSQSDPANYTGLVLAPHIDLEKLVNGTDADSPPGPTVELREPLAYLFVVTNDGDIPLTNVAVTDDHLGAVFCPKSELAVGESMNCVMEGLSQACENGNLGTVTALAGGVTVTDQDPAWYTGQHHASVSLEKRVEGQDADTAPGPELRTGSAVHWTYLVANTGDVALTGVALTDDRLGAVTCPKAELAVGESMTCEAAGTVAAGQYRNVGTVVANPPCGPAVSSTDPAHHYGTSPSIGLQKLTNGQDADSPTGPNIPVGSPVLWTYVVTNTGDTALTSVAVTDDRGVAVTCPKTELAPGESMICTAGGTAVAGQYANIGTVTGTPSSGADVTASDPSHYFGYTVMLSVEKRINGQDADDCPGPGILAGTPIAWTYLVTNLGDVKLTGVSVADDQGVAVTCPKTDLEPGETMTCTGASTAAAGTHRNVATATGLPLGGTQVSATDPACYTGLVPGIDLEKLINGQDADSAPGPSIPVGDSLIWTYLVTNTGDVTLTGVGVTDSDGFPVTCPKTTLAPGETMTCTVTCPEAACATAVTCPTYCTAVPGQQANIGTATGTPEGGSPVTDQDPAHYFGEVLGNQGCTPGYWKNHTGSWPPTGYSTSQDVDTVFASVNTYYPALGNASLLQALAFAGGPGGQGAAEILLRAAVAAVLNASHPGVNYPRTPASVIASVNLALVANRDTMLALAAQLDADNNGGCPLN